MLSGQIRLAPRLEGEQHATADLQGVLNGLQTRRVALPFVVTGVGVAAPAATIR